MASPAPSPSRRSLFRYDSPIYDKENAHESPIRPFGGSRGRISALNSSPTPAPLDSFETLDSPTKEEISRTFGTHYAKVLGKRAPLSPVSVSAANSPSQRLHRRAKSKPLIPSAPTSPVVSRQLKVNSPRRAAMSPRPAVMSVTPVPESPAAVNKTEDHMAICERTTIENSVIMEDNFEIQPTASEPQFTITEQEPEPVYDEYGFLCDSKRGMKTEPADGVESLLRDANGPEVVQETKPSPIYAAEETVQWWEKWLSEGIARESESTFSATLHPLRDASSPKQSAAKDSWRPVAIGMVMQYGVPHRLRRQVWPALAKVASLQQKVLQSCTLSETPTSYYRTLLKSNNFEHQTWSRIIRLDLDRTFATHRLFAERGGPGQLHLSNVLTAYAHHNPAIGYCQGMSFVAATLLMITECDEVEAFWLLCALMDAPEYSMCQYYSPGMQGLLADSASLSHLLRMAIPQVHQHLSVKCHIDVVYFTARWWLSMFTDLGSWSTTLRMWDLFFAEGRSALQRITVALLSLCKHDILGQDTLDGVLPYILNIPASKLESSLLFQTVDEIDLQQLDLKYQYWQKEEISKSEKKMQLEKLRREKISKAQAQAQAPSTPGAVARSLFSRIWEKISTPSQSTAEADYKYTQLATSSPPASPKPASVQLKSTGVATTGRAKRKRSDALGYGDDEPVESLDLNDPQKAASFVNLNAISGKKLDFDQADETLSPSKRRKLTPVAGAESAPFPRRSTESNVKVQKNERDSFIAFATPTKRKHI